MVQSHHQEHLPKRHMALMWCRMNVDATWIRCCFDAMCLLGWKLFKSGLKWHSRTVLKMFKRDSGCRKWRKIINEKVPVVIIINLQEYEFFGSRWQELQHNQYCLKISLDLRRQLQASAVETIRVGCKCKSWIFYVFVILLYVWNK